MFQREQHQAVLRVLRGLDGGLLERHHALFGGGTQLVLELGEYRISQDVDFLCSDALAFAELRSLTRQGGPEALFDQQRRSGLDFPREVRGDQYGIRFPLRAGGFSIKFVVISEGRIDLSPGVRPSWSSVACLQAALEAFLRSVHSVADQSGVRRADASAPKRRA